MTFTMDRDTAHAHLGQAREFSELEDLTNSVPVIGWSVMWWLDGVEAPHEPLRTILESCGLGEYVPKPPSPKVALHRALTALLRERKRLGTGGTGTGDVEKTLIRDLNDYDQDWMAFALVNEAANLLDETLSYQVEHRVKFHKKLSTMICVSTGTGRIEDEQVDLAFTQELNPYWQAARIDHTSRDLSVLIKTIIDGQCSIALRKLGGVYFVPVAYEEVLDRVRTLIQTLHEHYGGEPVFLTLGVPDLAATRREMSKAAHIALMDEGQELLGQIRTVLASRETRAVRSQTLYKAIYSWNLYRAKLDAYQEILADRRGAMDDTLTTLHTEVLSLVGQITNGG